VEIRDCQCVNKKMLLGEVMKYVRIRVEG